MKVKEDAGMKTFGYLSLAGLLTIVATPALAQFAGREDPMPVTAPKIAEAYWSAKPTKPTPYVAPNKVHWKLSEILAAHRFNLGVLMISFE